MTYLCVGDTRLIDATRVCLKILLLASKFSLPSRSKFRIVGRLGSYHVGPLKPIRQSEPLVCLIYIYIHSLPGKFCHCAGICKDYLVCLCLLLYSSEFRKMFLCFCYFSVSTGWWDRCAIMGRS